MKPLKTGYDPSGSSPSSPSWLARWEVKEVKKAEGCPWFIRSCPAVTCHGISCTSNLRRADGFPSFSQRALISRRRRPVLASLSHPPSSTSTLKLCLAFLTAMQPAESDKPRFGCVEPPLAFPRPDSKHLLWAYLFFPPSFPPLL